VLTILFNTVRPDLAFFGQKDAQQTAVVRRLAGDLGFETEVVVLPTIREESGLAMSSRNERLSGDERRAASIVYTALREAKKAFKKGERNAAELVAIVQKAVSDEPLARLDYVAAVERDSMEPAEKVDENEILIVAAVYFGDVRLIDNILLNRKQ
jgi:pantoate--beta-alanine ligase